MGKATTFKSLSLQHKAVRTRLKYLLLTVVLILIGSAALVYHLFLQPNSQIEEGTLFYIKTTDSYSSVLQNLSDEGIVQHPKGFDMVAQRMKLHQRIKPGKYLIPKGASTLDIVRKLRSGKYETQVIKIKAEMSRDSVISYLAANLEAEVDSIRAALTGPWMEEEGFTAENVWCIFLPDHYFFNWATDGKAVIDRFFEEYKKYWSKGRLGQAYALDLSAEQACILATIVDGEAVHLSEMPTIAGLYLNRLQKGMRLQADPTVLYMIAEEDRQRVFYSDLKRDHPYNTYRIDGLPPGPIMLPDKRAIAAVLQPEKHDYIFMSAKEDGSYYHYFTSSKRQHDINANRYRRMLDRNGIRR